MTLTILTEIQPHSCLQCIIKGNALHRVLTILNIQQMDIKQEMQYINIVSNPIQLSTMKAEKHVTNMLTN